MHWNKRITVIIIQKMHKIQQTASTKILRKPNSKLLKSNQTSTIGENKITLNDLCPEQKAKLGQLIKKLQMRKQDNLSLTKQNQELAHKCMEQQKMINELSILMTSHINEKKQFQQTISALKNSNHKQEEKIAELKEHLQSKKHFIEQKKVIKLDQCLGTDEIQTNNYSCQVKCKKKKQKQTSIQTDEIIKVAEPAENKWLRNHNSKSFEKIMRQNKKSLDAVPIKVQSNKKKPIKMESDQSDGEPSEEFEELAQKWLQLKQRNLSKIKSSGKKECEESSHSPKQFSHNDIYENNESFGPQKEQEESQSPQFDEIQLNKILKSKNFRASRILQQNSSSNRKLSSQQSANRHSFEKKPPPRKKVSNRPIDFYETDLLDLVSSINQP